MSQNSNNPSSKLNGQANGQDPNSTGPVFNVHRIYTKDVSFEAPHSPGIFNVKWEPKVDFDLQMGSSVLSEAESLYEVVLHLTVTIKLGEGQEEKSAFLIEVQQAGAFTVKNLPEDDIKLVLATTSAAILFPYANEAISNLAMRGGFPQLILPPINFEAMYAHHLENQNNETNAVSETVV